jgi:amino acid permease
VRGCGVAWISLAIMHVTFVTALTTAGSAVSDLLLFDWHSFLYYVLPTLHRLMLTVLITLHH